MTNENPYTILEMGPQSVPVYARMDTPFMNSIGNSKDIMYIGADCNIDDLLKFHDSSRPGTYSVASTAKNLPFGNEQINEIWLMNFIGGFVNTPSISENGCLYYEFGFADVFSEFNRILKPEGKITIAEIYTPIAGESQFYSSDFTDFGFSASVHVGYEDVRKYMKKIGFSDSVELNLISTHTRLMKQYGNDNSICYIKLTKE